MNDVRLWELARDLDLPWREVQARLAAIGVQAPNVLSSIPTRAIAEITDDVSTSGALQKPFEVLQTPASYAPARRRRSPRAVPPSLTASAEAEPPAGPAAEVRRGVLRRVLHEMRGSYVRMMLVLLVDFLATPLLLLSPLPMKVIVDSVLGDDRLPGFLDAVVPGWFGGSSFRLLVFAAIFHLVVVGLVQLQDLGSFLLRTVTSESLTLRFRARMFNHAQRLSLAFHDRKGTSDSLYRIQYDSTAIQGVMMDGVLPLVTNVMMLVITITIVARLNWQLALIALCVCPPLFMLSTLSKGRLRPRYREAKEFESSALNVIQEVMTSLRVVKAFGREDYEEDRFLSRSGESVRRRVRLAFIESSIGLLVNMTTAAGTAAVLFVGVRQVQSQALSLGELLVVVAYLSQLYSPLKAISRKVGSIQNALASAERAFELLDTLPDVPERPNALPLARAAGSMELRGVGFSYSPDHPVLRDINISIPAGARVGIAGRTGAGKTTLVNLIARFYDVDAGAILLDGTDIRDFRLRDLRDQFAIVLQEPVLFSTTILENIRYGCPDAALDDVVAATQAANAHDFVIAMPDGYDTVVGERGMRLSGGERQRVSLARAFLKDAPILILDEPTSSIDLRTEAVIMDAMERLMVGRTTFMIAHRLATLDYCDLRLELEQGKLVQASTASRATARPRAAGRARDAT